MYVSEWFVLSFIASINSCHDAMLLLYTVTQLFYSTTIYTKFANKKCCKYVKMQQNLLDIAKHWKKVVFHNSVYNTHKLIQLKSLICGFALLSLKLLVAGGSEWLCLHFCWICIIISQNNQHSVSKNCRQAEVILIRSSWVLYNLYYIS